MLNCLRDERHQFCKLQDCTLNVSNLFLSIPLLSYNSQNVVLNSKSTVFSSISLWASKVQMLENNAKLIGLLFSSV